MKLSSIYKSAVKFGIAHDPRKKNDIRCFEDTAVLYGNPNTEVKKALVGIDIEVAELLLANELRRQQGLDLVIAHHPEGHAFAALFKVMRLQVDILKKIGVPEKVAQELLEERQREVERRLLPANHNRAVDAAKLLNMPFMCMHTPADNHVFSFVGALMKKEKPKTVQDVVDLLMSVPEYKAAVKDGIGPKIIMGSPSRQAGGILVEMTGGTEGHKDVYDKIYKKGVRTLICMHLSEDHFKKVKDANLNVVIAGHISSDTLGLNLLLDNIEREAKEKLTILDCSGFRRVKRN
ncbi:MAG: NGG1p interacting factor NIF3 [Candidatus Omnitrophica bacterium]|nr:NGG1p interacting factor NIF3 [Candidatus Omnitrophota bacterium]